MNRPWTSEDRWRDWVLGNPEPLEASFIELLRNDDAAGAEDRLRGVLLRLSVCSPDKIEVLRKVLADL